MHKASRPTDTNLRWSSLHEDRDVIYPQDCTPKRCMVSFLSLKSMQGKLQTYYIEHLRTRRTK